MKAKIPFFIQTHCQEQPSLVDPSRYAAVKKFSLLLEGFVVDLSRTEIISLALLDEKNYGTRIAWCRKIVS